MKRIDVVNLIRCHKEGDDDGFDRQANLIAEEIYESGDKELANYIFSLISSNFTIVPMENDVKKIGILEKINYSKTPFYIPDKLKDDLVGLVNATRKDLGVKCFLFYGAPGTGKTEAASNVARLLKRNLWSVNIAQLIDSHLGETSKNINNLFETINNYQYKKSMIVLFDEIDSLALNRLDSRDLREMSRATTELFKGLDSLNKDVILIATTNLNKELDKALLRRFDASICFDVYKKDDLVNIGMKILNDYLRKGKIIADNQTLARKVFNSCETLPNPGVLKNIIKKSVAFSNENKPFEYLKLLFKYLHNDINFEFDIDELYNNYKFSLRDIEILTGISKSEVARRIKNGK